MFGAFTQAAYDAAAAQRQAAYQAQLAQQAFAQQQFKHDVESGPVLDAVRQPDGSYRVPELIECR